MSLCFAQRHMVVGTRHSLGFSPGRVPWAALLQRGVSPRVLPSCTPTFLIGLTPRYGRHVQFRAAGSARRHQPWGSAPRLDFGRRTRARAVCAVARRCRRCVLHARAMARAWSCACRLPAGIGYSPVVVARDASTTTASVPGVPSPSARGRVGWPPPPPLLAAPPGAALCSPPSDSMGSTGWISLYVVREGGEGGGPLASCVGHEGERDGGSYLPQVARCSSHCGGLVCFSLQSPSMQPFFLLRRYWRHQPGYFALVASHHS